MKGMHSHASKRHQFWTQLIYPNVCCQRMESFLWHCVWVRWECAVCVCKTHPISLELLRSILVIRVIYSNKLLNWKVLILFTAAFALRQYSCRDGVCRCHGQCPHRSILWRDIASILRWRHNRHTLTHTKPISPWLQLRIENNECKLNAFARSHNKWNQKNYAKSMTIKNVRIQIVPR